MNYKLLIILVFYNISWAYDIKINFEQNNLGDLPSNWVTVSKWQIQKLQNNKVISMVKNTHSYNLCYDKNIKFKDGIIAIKFKSHSGYYDQGGGIMWRIKDNKNYYVVRFNPLEDNFRFYKVINGHRIELASSNIHLLNSWHTMKIIQNKNYFQGFLDNKKLLDKYDSSIDGYGYVGIWTKSDAKTSFDDLNIKGK